LDYSYDVGGALKGLTVDGVAYASNMIYDLAGHTASAAIGPSGALQTTETSHFDPATGRLSSQVVQRGNELPLLLNLSYAYEPSGQLHESNDGNARRTYTYDAIGRLQQVDGTDPQNKTWTEAYTFNPYGSRLSVTATGMPPDGLPSTAYDPKTNHAVGAAYDEAGNQQQFQPDGPDLRAWYDQAGRMVKVTNRVGSKSLESIGYGPDGHKLFSQVGAETTYYFWDGNDVVATYKQSSGDTNWKWAKSAIFIGGRRLATILPGTVLYHHPDRIGTRLITNDKDNTTIYQETLPFGTVIAGNSPDPVNPIFTSYDRSAATGLDHAVNREFNPGQSFTQPDPLGVSAASLGAPQSLNLYAYAGNDPVNNTDPSGLEIRHESYRDGPGDRAERNIDNAAGTAFAQGSGGAGGWEGTWGTYVTTQAGAPGLTVPVVPASDFADGPSLSSGVWSASFGPSPDSTTEGGGSTEQEPSSSSSQMDPSSWSSQMQCCATASADNEAPAPPAESGSGEPNWVDIFVGDNPASVASWLHGGDLATGGAVMELTLIGGAFGMAGGMVADTAVTVYGARWWGNQELGCLTCQVALDVWHALGIEFSIFVEPSFPVQVGEAGARTIHESVQEFFIPWVKGITNIQMASPPAR
jgi:RHS repeat-associated protein